MSPSKIAAYGGLGIAALGVLVSASSEPTHSPLPVPSYNQEQQDAQELPKAPEASAAAAKTAPTEVKAEVKAPTPQPKKAEEPKPAYVPPPQPKSSCNPNYSGCLKSGAGDYDCASGTGNGPNYTGTVQVLGYDEFGLDNDRDGWACEK